MNGISMHHNIVDVSAETTNSFLAEDTAEGLEEKKGKTVKKNLDRGYFIGNNREHKI